MYVCMYVCLHNRYIVQISNDNSKYCYACLVPHVSAFAPAVAVAPTAVTPAAVTPPALAAAVPTAPSGQSSFL